ncbi:PfkB family carbohydrate kinase [Nocardioides sp.]|uniref:PfkB family carbohydrate kinase n=1 Tax=Nocardioides sp. TaxID=35761 RepID=UPI00261195A4|nr:PfkB family carbohydrate kinase [Nocardioides sp.]MDI6910414.1 PfkB family carbohydrate kinase [Nocardioides sp.]
MLIVGGTYHELCFHPGWDTVQGSGMRAAAALAASEPQLTTAVDDELAIGAELVANAVGVAERVVVARSEPVAFEYFTPLSIPRVVGTTATVGEVLRGDADVALTFGMLETVEREIRAKRLVLDPQQPAGRNSLERGGLVSDELALVLNATEARVFGKSPDLDIAVGRLIRETGAVAVVVKAGASGADVHVATPGGDVQTTHVPAFPTGRVWPLGSGDTFAAGFAHAWGESGADPVEAARVGSAAAAYWCSTQNHALPEEILSGNLTRMAAIGLVPLESGVGDQDPRVYLAGPFFSLGEILLVELARDALTAQGVSVFSPFHDVGLGDASVAQKDIDGLNQCGSVLALLDGSDFGTVFETGYAERAEIPCVGYASSPDKEGAKMFAGLSGELHTDFSTAVYRAAWRALGASRAGATHRVGEESLGD